MANRHHVSSPSLTDGGEVSCAALRDFSHIENAVLRDCGGPHRTAKRLLESRAVPSAGLLDGRHASVSVLINIREILGAAKILGHNRHVGVADLSDKCAIIDAGLRNIGHIRVPDLIGEGKCCVGRGADAGLQNRGIVPNPILFKPRGSENIRANAGRRLSNAGRIVVLRLPHQSLGEVAVLGDNRAVVVAGLKNEDAIDDAALRDL